MRLFTPISLCALILLGSLSSLWGQLPPNQPEQDCVNALPVCQNIFVQPNSYQGEGLNPNEIDGVISCLGGGEVNDAWYIFTVQVGGLVDFVISPVDPFDDYDWAVYNLTTASCADIATNAALEVSCNFSGLAGNTGPTASQPPGGQINVPIPVVAGETYVVNVSNWSGSTTGYTLDFTGSSAVIFDNVPPQMDPISSNCGNGNITIPFSENVLCNTVDPTDFTLTGPGGPYTVTGVISPVCTAGGTFDDEFTLQVTPAITMTGTYTVTIIDDILDNCGNVCLYTSEDIFISNTAMTVSASPDEICEGDQTTLSSSLSGVPGFTFDWQPIGSTASNPTVSPTTTTTYTLTATDAAGCPSVAQVTVTVKPTPTSTFSLPSTICQNQFASVLYTGSAPGNAIYQWDFGAGAMPNGSGQGPFGVNYTSIGAKTLSLTVIQDACVSLPTTQVLNVLLVPTAQLSGPTDVCVGDTAYYTYQGNAPATATFNWNFDGATYVENLGLPSAQGPYKVVWSTDGPRNVCIQVDNQSCLSGIACQTTNVQPLPNAAIDQVSNQCLAGNSFNFTYSGDPNVDTYTWDFGPDAVPATSSSPTPGAVTYLNSGPKQVSLVVTRNGCVGDSAIITFEVVPDPSANFSFSTGVSCQNEGVTFQYTGTSVGANQTYAWDFGAGAIPATSSQPNPGTIMYASGGTKTVSLVVGYQGCVATSVQQVTVNPGPIVNAGADKEFCDGEGGVQVSASVSGGTAPYFFEWTCDDPGNCGISNAFAEDPTMNPNIGQATDTVVYYFQVTDVNGCMSNMDSVSVIIKAKPLADAGPDRDICAEGPGAFLNGGPATGNRAPLPFTYQWLPADGLNDANVPNPFARPDTTTIYTLVVNSANGCTSDVTTLDTTSTVTVKVNALPIAEAGADTAICLNDFVQLQGSASDGGPNYTYAWTPATAGTIDDPTLPSPTVTPNFTTTFFLVVSSNGCDSYADSVEVIVDTKPTLSPGTDVSVCQLDSVQLDGAASGDPNGSNYRYQWSPAIGLSADNVAKPMAAPKQTTTYTVTATSEHGCGSDARTVLVTVESTPVVFLLSQDTVICEGSEITLSADHGFKTPPSNPVSYSWTPESSVTSSPYQNSVTVAPTSTTLYTVTASAPSGCATSEDILITVSPKVEATVMADTTRFCEGTNTQLTATGGLGNARFEWLPGAGLSDSTISNPLASPSVSTLYQVVISEGACSDTAQLELTINPAPVADYLASQVKGCEGLEVNFMENSTNGVNYLWDFGDGSEVINGQNPTYTYATAGSYPVTLRVIGAGGCEASITKTTVEISPSGAADFSSDPSPGSELALPNAGVSFSDLSSNGMSWYWDFGDGTISTEQHPAHVYQAAGEYSVSLTLTDINGCVSEIQYGPYIIYSPDLSVPNLLTPNDDGVNDRFTIQYTGNETYNLEIFDRWGRSCFQSDAPQDVWEGTDMNGGKAREGVYYYSLKIGDKVYNGNISLMR